MIETTHLTHSDVNAFTPVTDNEINKLYQEVRQIFGNRYLLKEEKRYIHSWFSRTKEEICYKMYYDLGKGDYQVINFASDCEWGHSTAVSKPLVMNYLFGLINGQKNYKTEISPN